MQYISDFDSYGAHFHFEPPVEVADTVMLQSLGQIAAAASGYSQEGQRRYAESIDSGLASYVDSIATINRNQQNANPEKIARLLQISLKDKHTVTIVR